MSSSAKGPGPPKWHGGPGQQRGVRGDAGERDAMSATHVTAHRLTTILKNVLDVTMSTTLLDAKKAPQKNSTSSTQSGVRVNRASCCPGTTAKNISNTNTNTRGYLWQRRRMRRAPRSPVPAAGTEPLKQTPVPTCSRPLHSTLRCLRMLEFRQSLWLRPCRPLCPLPPYPVNKQQSYSSCRSL